MRPTPRAGKAERGFGGLPQHAASVPDGITEMGSSPNATRLAGGEELFPFLSRLLWGSDTCGSVVCEADVSRLIAALRFPESIGWEHDAFMGPALAASTLGVLAMDGRLDPASKVAAVRALMPLALNPLPDEPPGPEWSDGLYQMWKSSADYDRHARWRCEKDRKASALYSLGEMGEEGRPALFVLAESMDDMHAWVCASARFAHARLTRSLNLAAELRGKKGRVSVKK